MLLAHQLEQQYMRAYIQLLGLIQEILESRQELMRNKFTYEAPRKKKGFNTFSAKRGIIVSKLEPNP